MSAGVALGFALRILGMLLIVAGLGGLFLVGRGWPLTLLGVIVLLAGEVAGRAAGTKLCPQCSERVQAGALKCRYCGFDFPPAPAAPRRKR